MVRNAPSDNLRDALAELVERITLWFNYATRSAILTSVEVPVPPQAGLLGEK